MWNWLMALQSSSMIPDQRIQEGQHSITLENNQAAGLGDRKRRR